jgi:hypothetical protein
MKWTELFQRKKYKWPKTHKVMFNKMDIKEIQIKPILRFHFTPLECLPWRTETTALIGKDMV